jgi:hypothetical protein
MRTPQLRHVARRAGLIMLAVFLLACAAGLAYVALLTHQTLAGRTDGGSPSLLPLIAMATGCALGGFFTLRVALHRSEDELAMSGFDR